MNPKICIFGIFFTILVVYIGGCRKAGIWLVKKDEPAHADAMVFLMGSITDRVMQAMDVYQSGLVGKVIIVEGGMGEFWEELKEKGANITSEREQIRVALEYLGIPSERIIILTGDAQSTLDEAMIIMDFIGDKPEIDTLLIVSSSPHMRRANMIFKNAIINSHENMCIICSPSSYTEFNAKYWWKSKDDIEIVLLEYLKLANYVLVERWN